MYIGCPSAAYIAFIFTIWNATFVSTFLWVDLKLDCLLYVEYRTRKERERVDFRNHRLICSLKKIQNNLFEKQRVEEVWGLTNVKVGSFQFCLIENGTFNDSHTF